MASSKNISHACLSGINSDTKSSGLTARRGFQYPIMTFVSGRAREGDTPVDGGEQTTVSQLCGTVVCFRLYFQCLAPSVAMRLLEEIFVSIGIKPGGDAGLLPAVHRAGLVNLPDGLSAEELAAIIWQLPYRYGSVLASWFTLRGHRIRIIGYAEWRKFRRYYHEAAKDEESED